MLPAGSRSISSTGRHGRAGCRSRWGTATARPPAPSRRFPSPGSRWIPPAPNPSRTCATNLRTHVRAPEGHDGVWFPLPGDIGNPAVALALTASLDASHHVGRLALDRRDATRSYVGSRVAGRQSYPFVLERQPDRSGRARRPVDRPGGGPTSALSAGFAHAGRVRAVAPCDPPRAEAPSSHHPQTRGDRLATCRLGLRAGPKVHHTRGNLRRQAGHPQRRLPVTQAACAKPCAAPARGLGLRPHRDLDHVVP
jgi:hypothetical protein